MVKTTAVAEPLSRLRLTAQSLDFLVMSGRQQNVDTRRQRRRRPVMAVTEWLIGCRMVDLAKGLSRGTKAVEGTPDTNK